MYKKIMVAADGSEYAKRVADQAIALASLVEDSVIELVYVLDYSKAKSDVLHSQDRDSLKLERRQCLQTIEQKLQEAEITYEVTFLHGEPEPTIVAYANQQKEIILCWTIYQLM